MSLTRIAFVCVVLSVHTSIVGSFSCPVGQYPQPNKGCTPCNTVCRNNNQECRFYCPDYFRKPDPNHGMIQPKQPPKVEIAPRKIIKDVPTSKTDVPKSKKKNYGAFPTMNSQTRNDKSNALVIVIVILVVIVVVLLSLTAVFIVRKVKNGRQRTVDRDIEMQEMNRGEEIEELLGDGAVAVQNNQAIENQEDDGESVSEVLEIEDVTNDGETDDERSDRHGLDSLLPVTQTPTHAEAAHAQAVPIDFSEVHTPETPNLPSQPESQIETTEPSVTESEIPSPETDNAQSTFPSPGTQVPGHLRNY